MTPGNKELRKKSKLQSGLDFQITKYFTGKCLLCGAEFKEICEEGIREKIRAFELAHGRNCSKFKLKNETYRLSLEKSMDWLKLLKSHLKMLVVTTVMGIMI